MAINQKATILFIEPRQVSHWNSDILQSPQNLSGKTFTIRLLSIMFKMEEPLSNGDIKIIRKIIYDYPELTEEVKERFPEIFD
jgi:hypothetical protein